MSRTLTWARILTTAFLLALMWAALDVLAGDDLKTILVARIWTFAAVVAAGAIWK